MGLFPRLVKKPSFDFLNNFGYLSLAKIKTCFKTLWPTNKDMSWFLIRWPDYWENWKQDISKIEKKSHWGMYCGPWLLKLLHYLLLIYVEWSHFQNWILRSLSFKLRYTISRQLPQWYSLLDCVCPICNSINPFDIISGIVGRDEKISQVKKIMEIQRNGDSSKTETSLQVRVGN